MVPDGCRGDRAICNSWGALNYLVSDNLHDCHGMGLGAGDAESPSYASTILNHASCGLGWRRCGCEGGTKVCIQVCVTYFS